MINCFNCQEERFDPSPRFGEATVDVSSTITNNLRYPGQFYDQETGLNYNGFRYYDPKTGRYLRTDPIGLNGGVNLFVYVRNHPVSWADPLGLFDIECCQNVSHKYVPTDRPTGKIRERKVWDPVEIARYIVTVVKVSVVTATGGFGTGTENFVIGTKYKEEEWAKFICLELFCEDTLQRMTLEPCKRKRGSEYWLLVSSEDIVRTVSFDPEITKNMLDAINEKEK